MDKDLELEQIYVAHKIKESGTVQTVDEHCKNTASLAEIKCPLKELTALAWLAGYLHDRGKYSDEFQRYIENAVEGTVKVHKGDVNHSSAGGHIVEHCLPKTLASQMIQTAVYSHHGLRDCLAPQNGKLLFDWSADKKEDVRQAEERYFVYHGLQELENRCRQADVSAKMVKQKIVDFVKNNGGNSDYGSREFFLGMYERLLMSLLVEGDRTDTALFMQGRKERGRCMRPDSQSLKNALRRLESRIFCTG